MRKYIEGDINIANLYLTEIPNFLADVECSGEFDCCDNNITSLFGMPTFKRVPYHIKNMGIFCYGNKPLTSLKGVPVEIRGSLLSNNCSIVSLEHGPTRVGLDFDCSYNKLKNLIGGPTNVGRHYICSNNPLKSLEGAPKQIGDDVRNKCDFYCDSCGLKSLIGAPSEVNGDFYCNSNKLTSLEGIPEIVTGDFHISYNKGREFSRSEIYAVCEVGGEVFIK
jgi:hypothetical protein